MLPQYESSSVWACVRMPALRYAATLCRNACTLAKLIPKTFETVAPSEADATLARESSRLLAARKLGRKKSVRIRLLDDGDEAEALTVPVSTLRLFQRLLTEMSQGNAVTLIPTHAELTTQQAADLLNVSRPYVVKLLDEAKIPSRTVGKYRRVQFDDLIAYKLTSTSFKLQHDKHGHAHPFIGLIPSRGHSVLSATVVASHTLSVLSFEPLMIKRPSGLNATLRTKSA